MLGRAPDDAKRFFKNHMEVPISTDNLKDGGFTEDEEMRLTAEKALLEEQAKRRIERALRMGRRRAEEYLPGNLIFFLENQVPLKEKTMQNAGKFIGPARVIATETRREEGGELRPGHVVWLYRNGRLIQAIPEQLRKASPYEQQIEALSGPVQLPLTITSLTTHKEKAAYKDISKEIPSDAQWGEAINEEDADPQEAVPLPQQEAADPQEGHHLPPEEAGPPRDARRK